MTIIRFQLTSNDAGCRKKCEKGVPPPIAPRPIIRITPLLPKRLLCGERGKTQRNIFRKMQEIPKKIIDMLLVGGKMCTFPDGSLESRAMRILGLEDCIDGSLVPRVMAAVSRMPDFLRAEKRCSPSWRRFFLPTGRNKIQVCSCPPIAESLFSALGGFMLSPGEMYAPGLSGGRAGSERAKV